MKLSPLALAILALPLAVNATETDNYAELSKSVITVNRLTQEDFVAPYASEVHNREDIEKSGAISLYDYLGRFSSVNVMPSYGNPYQQLLDMRGYGLENGFQNIVVSINGRRLNNIDNSPQLLSSIPVASIERIEIIKGSGSVAQGDGAMAGVINIVTRDLHGVDLSIAAGSHGYTQSSLAAGLKEDLFALQVLADNNRSNGFRKKDRTGKRDDTDTNNLSADLKLFPLEELELRLGKDRNRIETNYGSSLSRQEFNKKPKTNHSTTEQEYKVDTNRFGISYELNDLLSFNFDHAIEKKESDNITFRALYGMEKQKYDYRSTDFSTQFKLDPLTLIAGVQLFDGERKQGGNKTTKDNKAVYLQGQYQLGNTLLSAGARHEKVEYDYKDNGDRLKSDHKLNAWDFGFNHQYNQNLSIFANISQGFQAPDIDRFFAFDNITFDPIFNGFIKPAKSKNFNLGINHSTDNNQLKATLFYSRLKNEIYYYPGVLWVGDKNTNIDKSHKYGLEIQDRYQFNDQLAGHINYAWTVAKIDRENEGDGKYNGKKLPGVSPHSITASIDYKVVPNGTVTLTQNWRSRAYALNDFENNFKQKQKAFNTTDFGYSHNIKQFTLFAQINNLFNKKNGLWVQDDAIYPVNFTRTWYAGVKASF